MSGTKCHIRWMIRRDYSEVLRIEQDSFEFPWCEKDLIRHLNHRNCIGMVAEHEERVIGFMVYELHKTRLEILNLAVHPDYRRQGVASRTIAKLISKPSQQRRNRITLEVRETNLDAQLFFQAVGLLAIGMLPSPFCENDEDSYLMEYRLVPAAEKFLPRNRIRNFSWSKPCVK